EALFAQLAGQSRALAPACAWAFWSKDPGGDEFHAVRWAGLADGELPGFSFTPSLGPDPSQPVLIQGPLPGTSFGECTLIQPTCGEGVLNGLVTVAGARADLDAATRQLVRAVGEEMGATLLRLQALVEGRTLREPLTGRRPEDLFGVPAGLRQVAVAPIRCAGVDGTLQLARRLPRGYAASEVLLLQLLAERLGLLFAAGLPAANH